MKAIFCSLVLAGTLLAQADSLSRVGLGGGTPSTPQQERLVALKEKAMENPAQIHWNTLSAERKREIYNGLKTHIVWLDGQVLPKEKISTGGWMTSDIFYDKISGKNYSAPTAEQLAGALKKGDQFLCYAPATVICPECNGARTAQRDPNSNVQKASGFCPGCKGAGKIELPVAHELVW